MKNSKIAKLKVERAKQHRLVNQQQNTEILEALQSLYDLINGKEAIEVHDRVREVEREYNWDEFIKQVADIKPVVHIENDLSEIKQAIDSIKLEMPGSVKVDGIEKLVKAVTSQPLPKTLDTEAIVKAIINVEQRIQESTVKLDQAPDKYQPVRRVVKIGNRLLFDDNLTQAGSRGGGSGALVVTSDGTFSYITLNPDGSLPVTPILKKLVDDTTTTSVTYIGEAVLGTATSAASWRIKKVDETSGVSITWSGTGFNAIWDNRATTVTYS